jgi:hypothetical protein
MGEMNREALALAEREWSDPEKKSAPLTEQELDWQQPLIESFRDNDPEGMMQQSQRLAQLNMVRLANEGTKDDGVKFQATKFLLEQAGRGAIQKVEQHIYNDQMTTPELIALLRSKLARIQKVDPEFDVSKLLPESSIIGAELADQVFQEEALLDPEPADEVFEVEK